MLENAVLEGGQLDGSFAHLHCLCAGVQGDGSAGQLGARPASRATQQRLHAGEHLLEVERFGDVVVGSGLQALDLVLPIVTRGEDQDGIALASRAQAPDDLETGHFGQSEIDDGDIQGIFEAGEQRLLAIGGHIHRKAGFGEAGFEQVPQCRFILDNQHPHGMPFCVVKSRCRLLRRRGRSTRVPSH